MTCLNNKTIIRIAGTSHSGSTLLDLMLSNAENAFSCGEINALFRPYRMHHFNPECACSDPECSLWREVKQGGEAHAWQTLSSLLPSIDWFVDSSKDPGWLYDQARSDRCHGFDVKYVLIYKTPEEYALSRMKRGGRRRWKASYVNYHLKFLQIAPEWIAVRYADLARDPASKLKTLCNALGLEYFPGKENYWSKTHHTLFGSNSAKSNLMKNPGSASDNPEWMSRAKLASKKPIRYKTAEEEGLPEAVLKEIRYDSRLQAFVRLLGTREIDAGTESGTPFHATAIPRPMPGWYVIGKCRRWIQYAACRLKRARS